jgi:hypothetical protein
MANHHVLLKLPPILRAMAQLNLDTLEWLEAAGVRKQTIDRIDRATMRASLAVELAQDGSRKTSNLRRARDEMIVYLNQMRFLCLHGQLKAQQFDEAERRVEQIREGLVALEHLDLARWRELVLPALRPPASSEAAAGDGTAASLDSDASSGGDSSRPELVEPDDGASKEDGDDSSLAAAAAVAES